MCTRSYEPERLFACVLAGWASCGSDGAAPRARCRAVPHRQGGQHSRCADHRRHISSARERRHAGQRRWLQRRTLGTRSREHVAKPMIGTADERRGEPSRARQASTPLRSRSGVCRSDLSLPMVQGGRWGAVLNQGGGHFQPTARLLHRRHLLLTVDRREQALQSRRLVRHDSRQLRRRQRRLELEVR